jgi:alkylation response protein AidB-like acyl-CoA dehydrogenase
MVRTGEGGPRGISCIVVEKGTPGALLRRAGEEARLEVAADRDGDFRELPRAGREPDRREGQGFKIAMAGLDGGRLNIAACSIGGAQFCLDRTDRIHARAQAVRHAARDFQALAFRVADYATELQARG